MGRSRRGDTAVAARTRLRRDYTDSNNVFRDTGDWDHENSNATNNTGALTVTGNWTSNGSISLSGGVRGNRVTGTVVVTDDNWPRGARQVMKNAGVHVR
ncbi:hypothetical protein [Streptomyces phaeochromogenes]|uniref:hypothetical protein n=1 Tax=Streptomyces phaeochromogenes TaxID=1923 RepID=UPI003870913F|nr:hypothetical protein OG277_05495 [Streptomyces phaeochromogenes]